MRIDVLEEFVDAAQLGQYNRELVPWTDAGGLEALRRAYRERNAAKGLCRSCPQPSLPGLKSCAVHSAQQRASAKAHREAHRDEIAARAKAKRAAERAARPPRPVIPTLAEKRRASGACLACGREADGKTLCRACKNERLDRRKARRMAAGARINRCGLCGSEGHNRQRCERQQAA